MAYGCKCQHFSIWVDAQPSPFPPVLVQCDTCKEREYVRSRYHARDWANKHAGGVE